MDNRRGMITSLLVGAAGVAIYGISRGVQNGTFQRLPQQISTAVNNPAVQQLTKFVQNLGNNQNMQQISNAFGTETRQQQVKTSNLNNQ
ncbi:hypothetical protein GLW20_03910 [Virgibacillus halodenitrificans]|nr:hypothetical protein [Virgibacillus halodenitrificans]